MTKGKEEMITIFKALFLGGIIILAGCSVGTSDEQYVQQAGQHYANGALNEATIELKNALQQNPKNAEARFLLGAVYADVGNFEGAIKELIQASELGTTHAVAPLLARVLLKKGDFESVLNWNTGEALSVENQRNVDITKGLALLSLGRSEEAREKLNQAYQASPTHPYALLGVAELRISEGDLDSARDAVKEIFQQDQDYADGWSLLGALEQAAGDLPAAEEAYSRAIELKVDSVTDYLNRMNVRLAAESNQQLEKDLTNLPKGLEEHPQVNYVRGVLHLRNQDYESAQAAFERVLNITEDYLPALYYSATSHFNLGNWVLAEDQLDRYVAKVAGNASANRMLAMTKLRRGDFQGAESLLRVAVKTAEDETLSLLLVEALIGQNKKIEAGELLASLVEQYPKSVRSLVALSKVQVVEGKPAKAIETLKKAGAVEEDSVEVHAYLVQLYQSQGMPEKALATAENLVAVSNESVDALNLLAAVHLKAEDRKKAGELFAKVLRKEQGNYSANTGLAAMAIAEQDFEIARQYYDNILEAAPNNLKALMKVADLYMAQQQPEKAREVIKGAVESNPNALQSRVRLGWFYAREDAPEKIPGLFTDIKESYPNHVPMLVLLADSAYNLKNYTEAEAYLLRIRQLDPQNSGMAYSLAKTYAALEKNFDYLEMLKTAIELNPENILARVELANYQLVLDQVDEAQKHVNFLNQRVKGGAEVLLLEGKIAEKQGDFKAAVAAYRPIYEYTKNAVNLVRLANARWQGGEKSAVVADYKDWLEDHPKDQLVRYELASRQLALGNNDEAVSGYKQVLSLSPDNIAALNNLAWLLREEDQLQALEYAEKAYQLAPQSTEVMDTLARVLLERGTDGDKKRAARLLENISLKNKQ